METGPGTNVFICSGQTIAAERTLWLPPSANKVVTTAPGFGIDLAASGIFSLLEIVGNGQFFYIDNNASVLDASAGTFSSESALLISVSGSVSSADLLFIRSNGDFFANNARTVVIQGSGGLPELGFFDIEFSGSIFSQEQVALNGFTGGRGAIYTVNNAQGGQGGIFVNMGSNSATEATVRGDLTINTTGIVGGYSNIFNNPSYGIAVGVNGDLQNTTNIGVEAGRAVNINIADTSIVEGGAAAIRFSAGTVNNDNPAIIRNDGIIRNISLASDALVFRV